MKYTKPIQYSKSPFFANLKLKSIGKKLFWSLLCPVVMLLVAILLSNISGTGLTAREFCDRLLEEQHVAVVPGDLFGARSGSYVRISFAVSMEEIVRGMDRIETFASKLRKGETP